MTGTALAVLEDMERDLLERLAALRVDMEALRPPEAPTMQIAAFETERVAFDWLIGGVLAAETTSMLVADPGIGKTTLMVQLSLCLAAGRPFLDGRVPQPVPTLMMQAEGSRGAFQARLISARHALGLSSEALPWFIQRRDFTDFQIGSSGFERAVMANGAKLVILDTLGYFARFNENDSSEWKARVSGPLKELSRRTGAAFILVHHQPKVTEANKDSRTGRGSSAMLADVDHFWKLETVKDRPALRTFVMHKNRYGQSMEFDLAFDAGNALFRIVEQARPTVLAPPPPKPREPQQMISFSEPRDADEE